MKKSGLLGLLFAIVCLIFVGCRSSHFGDYSSGSNELTSGNASISGNVTATLAGGSMRASMAAAVGDAVENAEVWLEERPDLRSTTDSLGRYTINGVPAGTFKVVARFVRSGITYKTRQKDVIIDGAENKDLPLNVVEARNIVKGVIRDENGTPLPFGTKLYLWGEEFEIKSTDGSFESPPLPDFDLEDLINEIILNPGLANELKLPVAFASSEEPIEVEFFVSSNPAVAAGLPGVALIALINNQVVTEVNSGDDVTLRAIVFPADVSADKIVWPAPNLGILAETTTVTGNFREKIWKAPDAAGRAIINVEVTNGDRTAKAQFPITVRGPKTYTVTYNGNGNTGGSEPADSASPYLPGVEVTVLGNTGALVKTGYTFSGWNTASTGDGIARAVASTFNMGSTDIILYARWAELIIESARASVADVTVEGTIGQAIIARDVIITLSNDTVKAEIAANTDLSSWITNLPAGLTAKARTLVRVGASTVTIEIAGTPAAVKSEALAMAIPAGSLTKQSAILPVAANNAAQFAIVEVTATTAAVSIDGVKDQAITAKDVVVSLSNDTFKTQIAANTDLSSWITNLPAGLTAKARSLVSAGASTVTIEIAGTPAAVKSEALAMAIPAGSLTKQTAILPIAANNAAQFAIVEVTATTAAVSIDGVKDQAITAKDVVVSLSNDTFKAQIDANTDLSSWITNLPAGLTAKARSLVSAGASTVTIEIAGTPTAVKSEALAMAIPAGSLTKQTAILPVAANNAAQFAIVAATTSAVNIDGIKDLAITAKSFTVTLGNDAFKAEIAADTDLSSWITNRPDGLIAKAQSLVSPGATTITIEISGTPAVAKSEALAITIPAGILTTRTTNLTVSGNDAAKFAIIEITATTAAVSIDGLKDQAITAKDVVVSLANDTFWSQISANTDLAGWFTNLPAGLTAKAKTTVNAGAATLTIVIAGTPEVTKSEALALSIPAGSLTKRAASLAVSANDAAQFAIVEVVATTAAVNIDGLINQSITTQNVTVALSNDGLKNDIVNNTNLAGWFTNLPAGLSALAKGYQPVGSTTVTIAISGTPTVLKSEALAMTIPAGILQKRTASLPVLANNAAKFSIVEVVATTADVNIDGIKGQAIAAKEFTISLGYDTFKTAIAADADVSSWFTNRPAGLTAKAKSLVSAGATTINIEIAGTPAVSKSEALAITIPAGVLTKLTTSLTVSGNNEAKFSIIEIIATVADVIIDGTKDSAITAKDVTVSLSDDTFKNAIADNTDVSSWFTNLPSGLTAKVKSAVSAGDTTVIIEVAGTPSVTFSAFLGIKIPAGFLTKLPVDLPVSQNTNAKLAIIATSAAEITHNVLGVTFKGRYAAAGTFPTTYMSYEQATVPNGFWMGETEVTYELWYAVKQWAIDTDRGADKYTFSTTSGSEGSSGTIGEYPTSAKQQPVAKVGWGDVIIWCNALSEVSGKQPVYRAAGVILRDAANVSFATISQEPLNGFRLPDNNEWEMAARWKTDTVSTNGSIEVAGRYWTPGSFASGATADTQAAADEVGWFPSMGDPDSYGTKNVKGKTPNHLGLYDMSGNVGEFVFAWSSNLPVIRGGGISGGDYYLTQTMGATPGGGFGFRIVNP